MAASRTPRAGGRAGTSRSDDGQLDVKLSTPGTSVPGTNPEQLFGAGLSSCFAATIGLAAKEMKVAIPGGVSVDAEIDLGTNSDGYLLAARLNERPQENDGMIVSMQDTNGRRWAGCPNFVRKRIGSGPTEQTDTKSRSSGHTWQTLARHNGAIDRSSSDDARPAAPPRSLPPAGSPRHAGLAFHSTEA